MRVNVNNNPLYRYGLIPYCLFILFFKYAIFIVYYMNLCVFPLYNSLFYIITYSYTTLSVSVQLANSIYIRCCIYIVTYCRYDTWPSRRETASRIEKLTSFHRESLIPLRRHKFVAHVKSTPCDGVSQARKLHVKKKFESC